MKVHPEKDQVLPHQDPTKKSRPARNEHGQKNGLIKIEFYTDPLCCWSWAFEKPWRQLLALYGDMIQYRYVMCGMIPDWKSYTDPLNSVSKPVQMGPVWMHASQVTQVKMNYSIWHKDPPLSSYPSCIAVKTVALQSAKAENEFLFKIREALMDGGINIFKVEALFAIAEELPAPFDFEQFQKDWQNGKGKNAFRSDLQKARFHKIGRFPTLTLSNPSGEGIVMVGYRPFEALKQAFEHFQSTLG